MRWSVPSKLNHSLEREVRELPDTRLRKACLDRIAQQVVATVELELLLDVLLMCLNGFRAEEKLFGNILDAAPLPNQAKDLKFAITEPLEWRCIAVSATT